MKKIILVLVVSIFSFGTEISAQDLLSGGSNSWVLHTPDDGRTDMFIVPKINGEWSWGNQTIFHNDGSLDISNSIKINFASNVDNSSPGIVLARNEDFLYDGKYLNHYGFGFHDYQDNSSYAAGGNSYISGFFGVDFFTSGANRLRINYNGNVGIGSSNPDEKLTVKGKIHAEEVRVDLNVPADYVFQKYYTGASLLKETYKMPTLEEVAAFTKKNHHLPEIPSATQIQKEGLHLKQMTNLLLQKIEELTLYTLEQEKRINALESKLVGKKS
jgi:hypothetical protein